MSSLARSVLCSRSSSRWSLAPTAAAHPLGNFSVNHLTVVSVSGDRVELRYVLDQAEIPTFQERGIEPGVVLARKRAEVLRGLVLTVDGRRVELRREPGEAISFPRGQGGLQHDEGRAAAQRAGPAAGADRAARRQLPRPRRLEGDRGTAGRGHRRPVRRSVRRPDRRAAQLSRGPADEPGRGPHGDVRRAPRHRHAGRAARAGRRRDDDESRRRRLRRRVRARRGGRGRADPAAAPGVRLGRAARPVAGPRQGDGRRLPGRNARHAARRDRARRDRDGHPHRGRVRSGPRHAGAVAVRAAGAALPVAEPGVRGAHPGGRRERAAQPRPLGPRAAGRVERTRSRARERPRSRARERPRPHARRSRS